MRHFVLIALVVSFAACSDDGDDGGATVDGADAALPGIDGGGGVDCNAPTGTLHAQVLALGDGQEDRVYWLHVPASYDCAVPMPLLVDFHGTASEQPEEAYQTDSLIAFADREGVIVARPRSRSGLEGGDIIYRWDQNRGDLARNVVLAHHLVEHLRAHYAIDPARTYASGFSSGSNMVAQFLIDPASPFRGYAPIAGGLWEGSLPDPLVTDARIYLATGYRDYLWPYARDTAAALAARGLPAAQLWTRRGGGGHDLYAWHWDELWSFLDHGERAAAGAPVAPWTAEAMDSPADVLAIAREGDHVIAAGASGRTWVRAAGADDWQLEQDHGNTDYAALCFDGEGGGVVAGEYKLAYRAGAAWSSDATVPDFGGMLGSSWFATASCGAAGVVVAGNWSGAISTDGGMHFAAFGVLADWGGPAQVNGAATAAATGTTVVVGYYDYVARAAAGQLGATYLSHGGAPAEWWNAVAAAADGHFWAVGDEGAIIASSDDGMTWSAQTSGVDEDLYAVSFAADGQTGVAVGRMGAVVVTRDGGATWDELATGTSGFLGAVLVDGADVTVAGEDGVVLRATLP